MSIHDDRHTPSPASAPGTKYCDVDGMADLADDFDQIALVVDWLDACRNRDLAALLDLYADDATLECRCGEIKVSKGRAELESTGGRGSMRSPPPLSGWRKSRRPPRASCSII